MTDLEIARRCEMRDVAGLAKDRLGITDEHVVPYGRYKAKIALDALDSLQDRPSAMPSTGSARTRWSVCGSRRWALASA
jgi:formyltetrahydrofolate synthetase